MRIVAGMYRGRLLVAPKGHSTRPTADRVRQALFNVLEHAAWAPDLADARIMDVFAGSGGLGLEALSRGAAFCLFVDRDRAAREAIEANLAGLGCQTRAKVAGVDVAELGMRGVDPPFDVAFLDPPYGVGSAPLGLRALLGGEWLSPGGLAVVEVGADEPDDPTPGFTRLDTRTWGRARVDFLTL